MTWPDDCPNLREVGPLQGYCTRYTICRATVRCRCPVAVGVGPCFADFGPWGAWRAVIADVVALHDEFGDDPDPFVPLLLWMDFWRLLHDTVGWRPSP